MNCIFICIFNQEKYVEMAYLLLESIFLYGHLDENTNILIYTSTPFMNMIIKNSIFTENGDKIIFEINDTYNNIDKACKARLDLFNLPSIIQYNKILYLDTDILVKGDLNIVFSIIKEDILYTLEEGYLMDNDEYYGGKTLFGNEVNNYEDNSSFTSGILLFNNCETIKNLFNNILEDITNRPHNFICHDQPYIVYNAFKYNCYNNKILKQYAVNNDHNIHSDKIIHHFPGNPGIYTYKIRYMSIFLDNIKDIDILYNGAKIYNINTPPIKNTKFPLVAICVSYNYFDTLQFTLPANYLHFDKIYLITQEDDIQTIEFCKKFDNICVLFYDFKNSGKTFDKFGALNFAQRAVYEDYPESWYLIIDSDIVLPNNFIDILYKEKLNPNCIYGGIRNNLLKTSEFLDKRAIINDPSNINFVYNNIIHWEKMPPTILGCFQLYKKKCTIDDIDYLLDASHGDYIFCHNNFDIFCHLENILYFHLGQGGVNWCGKIVSFIDDINISLDNIYYIYEREFNNIYYDKNRNISLHKNPLKYIIQIGNSFENIHSTEDYFNIIVNSSNAPSTHPNTIYLTLENNRILNKLIEDYNIDFIEYLYIDNLLNLSINNLLNLSNIRPINIIIDGMQTDEILMHFNLYGYAIEAQTSTYTHIKLFKSVNIDEDVWTCSNKMRYDIYDFFKNTINYTIAEIGAHKGYSTKVLSKIFSKVYAVDNHEEWTNFNKNLNKDSTNIKYVMLDIYKDSWDILPNTIDVSFIDADHSYDGCKSDILNSIKRFKSLKYIILDDYGVWPGVKQSVDEFIKHKMLKFETFIGITDVPGPDGIIKDVNEGIICSVIKQVIEKNTINCIFNIGSDFHSGNFLTNFNLRKINCPLDFIYVDFETALQLISEKFENYLSDIVLFNKNAKTATLFYKKNTDKINEKFYTLMENTNINYMKTNHNKNNLLFNQNYLSNGGIRSNEIKSVERSPLSLKGLKGPAPSDLANWKSRCIFYNNNILNEAIYKLMKGVIKTFNTAFNKYNAASCLLFITKDDSNIDDLISIKKKYNIECFMIIICHNPISDYHIYDKENKCLFISMQGQEVYSYKYAYEIMLKYFNFYLIEKDKI